jgi:hypothetical protein
MEGVANKGCVFHSTNSTSTQTLTLQNMSILSCSARTSESGRCIKEYVFGRRSLNITNSTFGTCRCKSSEPGRGGGMYIEMPSTCDTLTLSELIFSSKKGFLGRDLFLSCSDIATVGNKESFRFYKNIKDIDNSLMGMDKNVFKEGIDLIFVLDGYKGKKLYVSGSVGHDSSYCGDLIVQCATIEEVTKHTISMEEECEIRIDGEVVVEHVLHLKHYLIHPKSSSVCRIEVSSSLDGEGRNVVMSDGNVSIEWITFIVPPSVGKEIETLLLSSGSSLFLSHFLLFLSFFVLRLLLCC